MNEGRGSTTQRRGRPTITAVLSMLLLGYSVDSEAQTEVAERPKDVSAVSAVEVPESDATQEVSTGPEVSGYLQYHFNQPIDTNNNGAAPGRFRVARHVLPRMPLH